jgi:hypothetical protein
LIRVAAPAEKVYVEFDEAGGWASNIPGMMVPVLTEAEQGMGMAELEAWIANDDFYSSLRYVTQTTHTRPTLGEPQQILT